MNVPFIVRRYFIERDGVQTVGGWGRGWRGGKDGDKKN